MKVEMRSIESVIPYAKNPRQNTGATDAVASSIREFGFRVPIVVDEHGVIIAGHTRLLAAQKLGLKKVPVHVAVGLTPEQVKAYRLADNKLHELSSWDMELLPIELSELRGMDVDLALLGFSSEELEKMLGPMGTEGLTDPDDIPEPPDEAVTQPGDLWILGNHRLLCGDSGKPEDVDRLLEGATVHIVNTDPPYNVKVAPRSGNAATVAAASGKFIGNQGMDAAIQGRRRATDKKLRPKDRPLEGDFVSDEEFARLLRGWFGNIERVLKPGGVFYIWGGYGTILAYRNALAQCPELYFSQAIIWHKLHSVLTRKDYLCSYELAFYGWRLGAGHDYYGPSNETDLWAIKKIPPQQMIHLTEKPVELAERAMQYSSRSGENVLDLFGGSGSTLIGAERTERKAYLMELDALYCDVAVQRWEKFVGKKAELIRKSA